MQRPEKFDPDRLLLTKKQLDGVLIHLANAQKSVAQALSLLSMGAGPEVAQSDTELVMRSGLTAGFACIKQLIAFNLNSSTQAAKCVDALLLAARTPQTLEAMQCKNDLKM